MGSKLKSCTILGAWMLSGCQFVFAGNLIDLPSLTNIEPVAVLAEAQRKTAIKDGFSANSVLLATATDGGYDPARWKTFFDKDPEMFASLDRTSDFQRLLVEKDLIGMNKGQIEELMGAGEKVSSPAQSKQSDSKSSDSKLADAQDANATYSYILSTKVIGAKERVQGINLEYKNGNVWRWRLYYSTSAYPLKKQDAYRIDSISPWVTENLIDSDICDAGLKIKKSLGFGNADSLQSFEKTKPEFSVLAQKVVPLTEEPIPMILLPVEATSQDLLNAAILCQQSLLLMASRSYAERAISAAKTDADRKKAKDFLISRLPQKNPTWKTELTHMEAYACSKNLDPDKGFDLYSKNIRLEPSFEYSYFMVGMLKREKGNYAGAQDMFEQVLKINPKYQKALFALAAVRDSAGDKKSAKKLALEAYNLYPYDDQSKDIYFSVVHEKPPGSK